ncbi:hypothetical protein SERLADRAFT_472073 [Serpula lacrymans var. lacrymans S7.9]|nr:uncharacterized protein SERLADRAFT_472073 [Serpula lacrymans var. lacrymans S7.9]EGO23208.1 hypothetical protein SERLADRAFT_472073 [Serpula lacrymans var. lacrymans S7.9]
MTSKGHIVFSNGFPDPYTVKCTCTLTLDQKTRIMQVDQHTINASLGVTASSWHKNNDANLGVVTEWLEQWASMAFSHDLQVDFFATTNIFAPGKQVINIDTKRGLLAPYDVLLMGDVKDNASLSEV